MKNRSYKMTTSNVEKAQAAPLQRDSTPVTILKVSAIAFAGLCFGFLFERSHVYEPESIRLQFVFRRWIMLKMFIGACFGACISFLILSNKFKDIFEDIRKDSVIGKPAWVVALGAGLLGCGMVTGGACPGMVLPQLGTGLENAWIIFLGGLAGALFFNGLQFFGFLKKLTCGGICGEIERSGESRELVEERMLKHEYAEKRLNNKFSLNVLLTGFALMSLAFCIVTETIIPFKTELRETSKPGAWYPSLCGLGIGFINLAAALTVRQGMGSSTGYGAITSLFFLTHKNNSFVALVSNDAELEKKYDNNEAYNNSSKNSGNANSKSYLQLWWQVIYLSFAIVGALISAQLANNFPSRAPGIGAQNNQVWVAFLGGFMMLFGSRVGSGCTSGHGIAGMPLMNLYSILGVFSMFGCGIVLALVMDLGFGSLELK